MFGVLDFVLCGAAKEVHRFNRNEILSTEIIAQVNKDTMMPEPATYQK